MNNYIYVDNSSTTRLNENVLYKMLPYLKENYGNASVQYKLGKISKEAIEKSREKIAKILGVKSDEIYFTGSGTEADNMALIGIARANKSKGKHIITSAFEHLAVINACKRLESEGFLVDYILPQKDGIINIEDIKEKIREDTILISIMYVNNELGTIQNVDAISCLAKENNILFHTDAVQAAPHLKIDASKYDALSISAHKFNGPKGVGALYLKRGTNIQSVIYGGHQEKGLRAGTENVAGIVGMAQALEYTNDNIDKIYIYEQKLGDYLYSKLSNIPNFRLNGSKQKRIHSILNFSFDGIDSNELKLFIEMNNIFVSTGSACNSSSGKLSHVLKSINVEKPSIRISLSYQNSYEQMDKIVYIINESIKKLLK